MVNATYHNIRALMQNIADRQLNAISWGTIRAISMDLRAKGLYLLQAQGFANRNSMPHAGLRTVRRYHNDPPEVFHTGNQRSQARSFDPIIVGDEDYRLFSQ